MSAVGPGPDHPPVVDHPDLLTPEWLTAALRAAGHDASVERVRCEPVGVGLIGANYRLHLVHAVPGDVPASLVAKLPSADPAARATVAPGYRAEVDFYTTVAPTVAIRTPRCWYGAMADDATAFVLLLEDLAPAACIDQLDGCDAERAADALVELAGLHGPRWCDDSLPKLECLRHTDQGSADFLGELVVSATEIFIERFGTAVSARDQATLRDAAQAIPAFLMGRHERFGLVHGDYRLDNLLFPPHGERGTIAVDWQTLSLGLPARDVGYFLGTSLLIEDRRAHADALIATYHRALLDHGVTDYPQELCTDDVAFGLLQGPLILTLGAAYGSHTERAEVLFPTMIERVCAAIRDLGTLDRI